MQHLEPLAHLIPELKELLAAHDFATVKELLEDLRPEDLAESWSRLSDHEKVEMFQLLDPKAALVLFESLDHPDQAFLLKALEDHSITKILEGVPVSDIAGVFHTLPKKIKSRMLTLSRHTDSVRRIEKALEYKPDTAGALMHPEYVAINPKMSALNALWLVQSITHVREKHLLRSLYVINSKGKLIGGITLEDLISAPADILVEDLMSSVLPYKLTPEMDQEHVSELFTRYNVLAAPVVDPEDQILGVVLIDDIIKVVRQEADEDLAKIAGTQANEFSERSFFKIAWIRAPWLLATLLTQLVVSLVMRHFQFVLQEVIALATFLPLVAAMGGNVGSQSAMITVRSLAIGKHKGGAKLVAVLREAATGTLLGAGYGLIVGTIAWLMYGGVYGMGFVWVVGLAVFAAMLWASIVGATGPLVFEKVGADPATAMGPMVTTTTDLFSITVYFMLAILLLMRT
jgi:magnesium transporter